MIRILVVSASPSEAHLLAHILSSDTTMEIVGISPDGKLALSDIPRLKPDVVIMDMYMPRLDGIEATQIIMEKFPLPIILLKETKNSSNRNMTTSGLDAGALQVVIKPHPFGHEDLMEDGQQLIRIVKAMSEVKVIRRIKTDKFTLPLAKRIKNLVTPQEFTLVVVGSSTGGPAVLKTIFSALPMDFPVPILVVQHMAPGFIEGLAKWITTVAGIPALVAQNGETIHPRQVYFAPDGFQMLVQKEGKITLSRENVQKNNQPSVSRLFASVAQTLGKKAIGVLLTGMGDDGAKELKIMRDYGGITIAQNQESSVVYGMPGEAVKLDAADYILSPLEIALVLERLVCSQGIRTRPQI